MGPVRRIAVGFSTIPSRMEHIGIVLRSMARQTRQPQAVYINVPRHSARDCCRYDLDRLEAIVRENLPHLGIVVVLPEDYGPLCKLMGTLFVERDPRTLIVTVDDDHDYNKQFLETLERESARYEGDVVCMCALRLHPHLPIPMAYRSAVRQTPWPGKLDLMRIKPGERVNMLQGVGGVAYPRSVFDDADFPCQRMEHLRKASAAEGGIPSLFVNDDMYISAWMRLLGVDIRCVAYDGAAEDDEVRDIATTNGLCTPPANTRGLVARAAHMCGFMVAFSKAIADLRREVHF